MHNGFLQVEGEKMSKSLGNFITIRQLLDEGWPGEVLRFNMLRTHYRQPIDWTKKSLEESQKTLNSLYAAANGASDQGDVTRILEDLSDDLNTPKAIASLHSLRASQQLSSLKASLHLLGFSAIPAKIGLILGYTSLTLSDATLVATGHSIDAKAVQGLIAARLEARKRKDFNESDRIRDELAEMGVTLKDTKNKDTGEIETTWELQR
jgi:cysteinyl-tRNA synthetase